MRILFVAPFYYPELKFGGPPKRLHAMANALHANGHDVDVLTIDSEEGDRSNRADYGGVSVQYLPWRGRALNAFPTSLQAVRGAVRSADVVHCFGLYNFICPAAVRVARRATKPVLLEPMGMYVPRVRTVALKRIYNATITGWMAKRVAAIVATSEIELAELQPLSRFARVVLRRNGIDVAEFRTLPARELMRQRWGIPPDAKVVLYVGRISEKKRLLE
jgi:glycosyltransferase involved in cell wall biosynthesis